MFASATLKLTGSYLAILLVVSLLFSSVIFELATSEISERLERFQSRVEQESTGSTYRDARIRQTNEAKLNLFIALIYANLTLVALGGVGSFALARRTLRPIERAHEAQSRFASDASHELRTPLAVMQSEIQVALRDPNLTKKEMIGLLESNLEEVQTLSALSTSLLELSRMDHTPIERSDDVHLVNVLHSVCEPFIKQGKQFDIDVSAANVTVKGNMRLIEDIVRIVIDNAVKYGKDNNIHAEIHSNGRDARLIVRNKGHIDDNDLPYVTEAFYRSRRVSGSVDGHGLGLALAKKIAELHDGSIKLENENDSVVCTVSLPHFSRNR